MNIFNSYLFNSNIFFFSLSDFNLFYRKNIYWSINSFNSLNDYRGSLHIAPLLFGAGVKIKVIDAYESGIPTLGTKFAFQGIEEDLIDRIGICVDGLEDICKLLLSDRGFQFIPNNSMNVCKCERLKMSKIVP